ncbi:MAG: endonuclease V [Hyphomonadaceae bacterium]
MSALNLVALDAAYADDRGAAAGVAFADWDAAEILASAQAVAASPAAYEPGAFYKRELPLLLDVLQYMPPPKAIIVDGYVWLSADGRPGLGAHLHQALGGRTPIIGVAKTQFRGDDWSAPVLRGASASPLFVTAAGMACEQAAAAVQRMAMGTIACQASSSAWMRWRACGAARGGCAVGMMRR